MKPFLRASLFTEFPLPLWVRPVKNDDLARPPESNSPRQVLGGPNHVDDLEYDAHGRFSKVSGPGNSYYAWRYETHRIVRSFYSGSFETLADDDVYLLDAAGQLTEKIISTLFTNGGKLRYFNIAYDAEGHVLHYETETSTACGTVVEGNRYELTWQNGNLVRRRQFDRLRGNTLLNDRTYEYDLSKINTLFPQVMPNRFHFGLTDPNLNLGLLFGKGNRNVVLKDSSTANPSKFGAYTYEFDGEGRIKTINYFGGKLTISY